MGAIAACRTAALGGHIEECDDCGARRIAYNSCRNRHCPKCQGAARAAFGDVMKARWQALHPDHGEQTLATVHGLFLRAPTVLGVVSAAQEHPKIPLWEQQLSAAAVCSPSVASLTRARAPSSWVSIDS